MLTQRIPHPVKPKGSNTGPAWNLQQVFKDIQGFVMLTYNRINFSQVFQIQRPTKCIQENWQQIDGLPTFPNSFLLQTKPRISLT